MQTDVLPI